MPSARTVDPGYLIVELSKLKYDSPKLFYYNEHPVLLTKHRDAENRVVVFGYLAIPRYRDKVTRGCMVQPSSSFPEVKVNPRAMFFEPCRIIYYDINGEVLPGSGVNALGLIPVRVRVDGKQVKIGKFT